MENITLISPKPALTLTTSCLTPRTIPSSKQCFGLPFLPNKPNGPLFLTHPRSATITFAFSTPNSRRKSGNNKNGVEIFASTSRGGATAKETTTTTTSVGVTPQPYNPPPSSQFGSPLFWIGVGVGFSALFSFGASWLKKYAMQQAFKTMMGQMGSQNNQFSNAAFSPSSPFGFPPPSSSGPSTPAGFPYQPPSTSGPSVSGSSTGYTFDASASRSQVTSPSPSASQASVPVDRSAATSKAVEPVLKDETETKSETKQSAFVDVSPEETMQTSPFENYSDSSSTRSSGDAKFAEVVQNGAASRESASEWSQPTSGNTSQSKGKGGSMLSVETLEKMMEDPNVQKMIYPHLPEEMRNPATFKWMLQNPVYRQQLQEMLDNGGGAWDGNVVDNLKNFDLSNPEIRQQFDQIGLTPEEAISKIMANPDVAMAFQNPKIQQALMDCSQNPMNIVKYQNDKEVMDVFTKIQELFPGAAGPPGF